MSKYILSGTKISIPDYASQGNAVLGIRDSGKTYTATYMAERLLDNGIPIVVFDPIGVWKYLRVPGAGKPYKVVVAGGKDGDLALTPESAPEIVRAAMRENVPLVLDFYDMRLSKSDWKRIVEQSVRLLLYENGDHGLRHIFIEEAAEFAPQRVGPDQGRVYAEIEKLARMGGNAKLGYTLINQRAEEVNKAVLELCDCLFLHRQKGKNSLTSLSKWLDFAGAGIGGQVTKSLPLLDKGECWVWSAGSDEPVKISVPQKKTHHPDRRAATTEKSKSIQDTDVSAFVDLMRETLGAHIEEAKKNDPVALKKRIAELEKQLLSQTPEKVVEPIYMLKDGELDNIKSALLSFTHVLQSLEGITADISGASRAIGDQLALAHSSYNKELGRATSMGVQFKTQSVAGSRVPGMVTVDDFYTRRSAGSLPDGEQKILIACRQFEQGLTRKTISVLTGYKRSTRDAYIQRLSTKGFVVAGKDNVSITQLGVDILGSSFNPLPTGSALRDYWLNELPDGERAILEILIERYPANIDRDFITSATGYKRSTRDAYIQRMVAKNIVTVFGGGLVRASDELFDA